ncbi:MAG TPA: DNA polymerase III subunit [Firmicutes bacterium]|nr:DNA polymerase III subunit [Candidatus Fermentithermobacillaceae bacterium]
MNCLIAGQEVPIRILKAILRSGRIAHAYLFKGPTGSGKAVLAREFAKGILCLNESSPERFLEDSSGTELSCGVCASCSEVGKNTHPDLFMIEKDGTSIKIRASHGMLKEVLTRPFVSRRKVFIINEAESLTAEAANALLKLLEEPPSYVTFILTTSNESAIPGTVISRCQVIPLRALPAAVIAKYLEDAHGVPEDQSREISSLADGSVNKAMWLLSQMGEQAISGEALAKQIAAGSPVELALEYSKADLEERHKILATLELEFARRLSRAAMEYDGGYQGGQDTRGTAALRQNFQALKSVMRARERLGANTNSFLVFCTLFMDVHGFVTGGI